MIEPMYVRDPQKLLQAARTAVCLISLVHETLWELYPDELLLMREADENHLLNVIGQALRNLPPPQASDCPF
ncbi:hypothetical protein GW813_12755 [bacterium]|nr:hypothetical protein [bacterium]